MAIFVCKNIDKVEVIAVQKNNTKGFTLTEMIVVIAVSGILFSIIALMTSAFYNLYQTSVENSKTNNEISKVQSAFEAICNNATSDGDVIDWADQELKIIDGKSLIMININSEGQLEMSYPANINELDKEEYKTEVFKYIKEINVKRDDKTKYFDVLEVTIVSDAKTKTMLYKVIKKGS